MATEITVFRRVEFAFYDFEISGPYSKKYPLSRYRMHLRLRTTTANIV